MDKKIKFEIGNIYAVNANSLKGHFLVLLDYYGIDDLIFLDIANSEISLCSRREADMALKHKVFHDTTTNEKEYNFRNETLTLLDLVEKLPDDIFECIKANIQSYSPQNMKRITLL